MLSVALLVVQQKWKLFQVDGQAKSGISATVTSSQQVECCISGAAVACLPNQNATYYCEIIQGKCFLLFATLFDPFSQLGRRQSLTLAEMLWNIPINSCYIANPYFLKW